MTAAAAVEADAAPPLDARVWKTCAVVLLGPLMAQLDATVVNVSLATLRTELHATIAAAQWVVGGYLLALALMLPLNAWLVDRVGAKRLYLACFTAFTLASLLCGAAASMPALIAARVLQGMAGGLLAPMAQMMIARIAGRHMARLVGYAAMPVLIAPIVGPSLAGAILKFASWPWLFYLNLPVGVLAVVLAARLLPRDEPSAARRAFDLPGFLLIAPGLAAIVVGLDHAGDAAGLVAGAAGALLLVAFARHALRQREAALLDVRLFAIPVYARAVATQFLSNVAVFAGQMLIPLFLIAGCGLTAARAGLILAPLGLGMLCSFPAMGWVTDRLGCRAVAAGGAALTLASTLPILWMSRGAFSPALMAACLLLRGMGQGATGVPTISAAYAAVPKAQLPLATSLANIAQRIGGPVGTTALALVLSASASATTAPAAGATSFTAAFAVLLALQALVVLAALRLPARIHPQGKEPT